MGQPLVRDSGLRLPAQLHRQFRHHHLHPGASGEAGDLAADLQELRFDGQDASGQTPDRRTGEEVSQAGGRHEKAAGDDGAL